MSYSTPVDFAAMVEIMRDTPLLPYQKSFLDGEPLSIYARPRNATWKLPVDLAEHFAIDPEDAKKALRRSMGWPVRPRPTPMRPMFDHTTAVKRPAFTGYPFPLWGDHTTHPGCAAKDCNDDFATIHLNVRLCQKHWEVYCDE